MLHLNHYDKIDKFIRYGWDQTKDYSIDDNNLVSVGEGTVCKIKSILLPRDKSGGDLYIVAQEDGRVIPVKLGAGVLIDDVIGGIASSLIDSASENTEQAVLDFVHEGERLKKLMEKPEALLDICPLTNCEKRKQGYLDSLVATTGESQKRYFVILGDRLYFYHERETDGEPNGSILLKHVSISPLNDRIEKGEFAFQLETPFQKYTLQAKHQVDFDDWCEILSDAKQKEEAKKVRMRLDFCDFNTVMSDKFAITFFSDFLNEISQISILEFCNQVKKLQQELESESKNGEQKGDEHEEFLASIQSTCVDISSRFLESDGEEFIPTLASYQSIVENEIDNENFATCFDQPLEDATKELRENLFQQFQRSEQYKDLLDTQADVYRQAQTLFGDLYLIVSPCTSSSSESDDSRKYLLKTGTTTIGRDWSNTIVINDPKISRVHCKLEIDNIDQCVLKDLGTSRGTKLNGRRIIQKGLSINDVVTIGNHQLRFELRNN